MNHRAALIKFFTFLGGIYFFLQFVLPTELGGYRFGKYHEEISDGFILVGAMAVGVGLINLLLVHGSKFVFRRGGWINSAALLLGLAVMMVVTSRDWLFTNSIAQRTQEFDTLSKFSAAIAADHKAGVSHVRPYWERNQILAGAVAKRLSEVKAAVKDTRTSLTAGHDKTWQLRLEASAAQVELLLKETELSAAKLDVSAPEGAAAAASTAPDLGANQELQRRMAALQVAWRELLTVHYEKATLRRIYDFLYKGLFMALGAAMFSLLGFYIASAAYRAFRIKSAESGLMMAAALLVMLGQIPFGIWLWGGFPDLRLWLLQVPNAAASRAIEIGAAIAGLVMAFRMWLSIEAESFK